MNCSIFKNNLNSFLEGNISADFEKSMEQHTEECETCRNLYEREKIIEDNFRNYYSVEGIQFKSSRNDIMKQINKDRYKNNFFIKGYTNVNRNRKTYIAVAAALVLILVGAPLMSRSNLLSVSSKSSSSAAASMSTQASDSKAMLGNSGAVDNDNKQDIKGNFVASNETTAATSNVNNQITFTKEKVASGTKIEVLDKWKASLNGKYEACIEGRVSDVDFGIRKLYLKDKGSGDIWSFSINNKDNKQDTPMYLEWTESDESVFIVVGLGYGTVSEGGSIYQLNLKTGAAALIYKPSELEQVKSFQYNNGGLSAAIKVFEDDSFNKFHVDNINISAANLKSFITNMNILPSEASIIYEYQEDINNSRTSNALKLISSNQVNTNKFDENMLLKNISSMSVTEITQLSSGYTLNDISNSAYQKEVFSATIDYKLKAAYSGNIKEGMNKAIIVLTKDSEKSYWKIGEIQIIK